MHAFVFLLGVALAGGPRAAPEVEGAKPTERRVVFDRQAERGLEGVLVAPAETTPPLDGFELFETGPAGSRRSITRGVSAAQLLPDGAILAVRKGALVELRGKRERILAKGLLAELAVDPTGRFAVVARMGDGEGTTLELLDLKDGKRLRRLTASRGYNTSPMFTPDGGAILFVSSRTGLSCLYRVGVDGQGEAQLTNAGKTVVDPDFVPPMSRVAERRFEGGLLLWSAGAQRWSLDLLSGAVRRLEGGAR
ncbi:MAG: PD40 domain-containing protein [Deltaproteobacteria bacterium]|nr:PD40 domain-containing protein [Deltaproteobacteria bacterium]